MGTLWQDLRYGVRMLRQRPGFTVVALLALALGIGVNTTIFSAVNGFVLRPLPVKQPEEVVQVFWGSQREGEVWNNFSYPNFVDLREQNKSFSGLFAWQMLSVAISDSAGRAAEGNNRSDIIWGETVSGNYFDVLGVQPMLGRGFLPEEDRTPNTHPVVVLSQALWQRRFNADPAIIGRAVYLNGQAFTVIGVAPAWFRGVKFAIAQDFWVPLMMQAQLGVGKKWQTARGWQFLRVLGRLKPGVTREQARADLNLIGAKLAQLYPRENAEMKIAVVPEVQGRFEEVYVFLRFTSLAALGVVSLVLLVACANVANLLLSRAAARSREIGIRLALGASRWRIVRQLLTESMLLAVGGGSLGWLLAFWGSDLVHASIPPLPYRIYLDVSPDWRVFKWTAAISLLTGLLFGLVPALIASRPELVSVLKGEWGGQRRRSHRWNLRNLLVVAQVTISLVVLVCAGLFLRSLGKAQKADPGFRAENLVTLMLDPGLLNYSTAEGKRFYAELLRRLEQQPGVRAAALGHYLPLGDSWSSRGPVLREGEAPPRPNQGLVVDAGVISPNYFETMGTPLVLGRGFTDRDRDGAPAVMIINQALARRLFGSEQQALGQRLRVNGPDSPLMEIVGIAKSGLYRNLYEEPRPYLFLPQFQGEYESQMTLLVSARTAGDVKSVAASMRREIAQLDARIPVFGLQVGEQNLSYAYWGPRLGAGMAGTFGVLALVLATMGLYSVLTYSVSQRTKEIGIRLALGAQAGDVLRMVIWQGLRLVAIGGALGLLGAIALGRVLVSLLFGVSTTDPLTLAAIASLLAGVALLACYLPARRAMRVDPMVALRYE